MRWVVLLLCHIAIAQKALQGLVLDKKDHLPLPGALVKVNRHKTLTNNEGFFTILLEESPPYFIEVRYVGYQTYKDTLYSFPSDTLKLFLQEQGISLQEQVITAARLRQGIAVVPVSLALIKPQQVDIQATADLVPALQQSSGITVFNNQLSIRGSSGFTYGAGSRVMMLWNGMPLLNADRMSVNFDMIPVDNIERIEVVKGASSVLYGAGALGGVVHVITAAPGERPATVLRTRMRFFDQPRNKAADWDARSSAVQTSIHFFHNQKIKNLGYLLQLDLIYDSGYIKEAFSRRIRTIAGIEYRPIQGLRLGFLSQWVRDSSATVLAWGGYPQKALMPGPGFLTYEELIRYVLDPYVVYLTPKGHIHSVKSRVYHQINRLSTAQSGTATLYFNEYQYTHFFSEHLQTVFGVQYVRNIARTDSVFGNAFSNQAAAFLQIESRLSPRLRISAGVRYQYEQITGSNVKDTVIQQQRLQKRLPPETFVTVNEPLVRFGINYRLAKGTYLRGSWGQGIRSPSIAERFTATQAGSVLIVPNPKVQVEKGYSAELGIKQLWNFKKVQGFLDVAAFAMVFQNMVEFYVDTLQLVQRRQVAFSAQNIAQAEIRGIEAEFVLQWRLGRFWQMQWQGGYTFVEPRDRGGNPFFEGDDQAIDSISIALFQAVLGFYPKDRPFPIDRPPTLKYRSKHMLRSSLTLNYKTWNLTVNYRYNSHIVNVDMLFLVDMKRLIPTIPDSLRFFPDTYEFRKQHRKGWHVVDVILTHAITPKDKISFHVFNLLNTEYMPIPGTLIPQRSFALQYKKVF